MAHRDARWLGEVRWPQPAAGSASTIRSGERPARRLSSTVVSIDGASTTWKHISSSGTKNDRTWRTGPSINAISGIAWADLDTGTALVATIHPALGRDSHQRPDGWHLHTVQLAGGATAPNDFCLVAVLSTPTAGIQIKGSTMTINLAASKLPDGGSGPISVDDIDAAVGFTVHGGDAGCATGLGVRVRT